MLKLVLILNQKKISQMHKNTELSLHSKDLQFFIDLLHNSSLVISIQTICQATNMINHKTELT